MMDEKQNTDSKRFVIRVATTTAAVILILCLVKIWYVDPLREAGSNPTNQAAPTPTSYSPSQTTVPAKTLSTSGETKVISWKDAANYYGQYVTVEGQIVATHNSGKACFLNFHSDRKRYIKAVIFASSFDRFPPSPENFYSGKHVRVTGMIKEYDGKPEIILNNPSQVQVME